MPGKKITRKRPDPPLPPGIERRPGIDALIEIMMAREQKRIAAGTEDVCGVCGRTIPMLRWHGCCFLTEEGLTPWMCSECAAPYRKKPRG